MNPAPKKNIPVGNEPDYTTSDLGYQPNTAGPGKEAFKPKNGGENKRGNAPRQDGVNSKKSGPQAQDCLWGEAESEGGGKTDGEY